MPIVSMFPGGGVKDLSKAIVTLGASLVYNGEEQTQSVTSVVLGTTTLAEETDYVVVNNIGVNAGSYTMTVFGIGKYGGMVQQPWNIDRAIIATLPSQSGSLIYNGNTQFPTWNNFDSAELAISGTTSAVNAGSHAVTFTPTSNYKWWDGTIEAKNATWVIGAKKLTKPAVSGSRTYNGVAQEIPLSNFDAGYMSKGGAYSATNAGTYTATVSLIDITNLQWEDGSNTALSLSWTINKAAGSISVSPTSLSIMGDVGKTAASTITKTGDGAVSVSVDDSGVATASVSGDTVTVQSVGSGNATVTVTLADGVNYIGASCSIAVSVVTTFTFGVCWNYGSTSTALTRLTTSNDPNGLVNIDITTSPSPAIGTGSGSSPFDSYAPWNGMEEYNIVNNAVSYKKGQSGFSRTSYDTVVKIPEFYFRIINNSSSSKRYFYISSGAKDGFTKHPGSGRYVGKYNVASGYVSKSGLAGLVNITRATARTGAKGKGAGWSLWDIATWNAIQLLFIVEFADWNSQTKVGRGVVDADAASNNGATDSMTYHTGRAAGTDGKTQIQYRGIEGLWGNLYQWIDGINENGKTFYVCTDPSKYADSTSTSYTNPGFSLPGSGGYIKKLGYSSSVPWLLFVSEVGGSDSTYIPDYSYSSSSSSWFVVDVGGSWCYGSGAGLACARYNGVSGANASIGSRLLYIP